jgi:CubicO group peptidase (beta-lactamase class C family)
VSDQPRSVPDRASLRYLKLEAKRRLAAGEFSALHEAQLAIAREHGMPSWAALKRSVDAGQEVQVGQEGELGHEGDAVPQIRWVTSRFADADDPAWTPPAESELREHFADSFLEKIPPAKLVPLLARRVSGVREDLVVTTDSPQISRARVAGLQVHAAVEDEPPHRLIGLRLEPVGSRVADDRVGSPGTRAVGAVPAPVAGIADAAFAEFGLVGVVLAGAEPGGPVWAAATGWADLDRAEALTPASAFPVGRITMLITSTAVLRLVADERVGLDHPVNRHLRTVRLADDTVTLREVLTHAGGLDGSSTPFTDRVRDLDALFGPVVPGNGERGVARTSDAGYGALGQMIADVTGQAYADAARRLVLDPLGMTGSWFPDRWPGRDRNAVTGYRLADGAFAPAPERIAAIQAAAGLWASATDLVRFALGWSSLLPGELAAEALRPQAARLPAPGHSGFGWLINSDRGVAGMAGLGPGAGASLVVGLDRGDVNVALTNRRLTIEPVNGQVRRSILEAD